jgi:bis(5'-nucleosyl)-tetraphosphatase (symmetrical)
MATYAIGDVQGCHATLMRLVDRIGFDPRADRLWFAGDVVNRGPSSLAVLRYIRSLGDAAVMVLGNHDLHLIARFHHIIEKKERDTLNDVLSARDAPELIDWLAHRPLTHAEGRFFMVHAGLLPTWTIADATSLARGFEARLKQPSQRQDLLTSTTKPQPLRIMTTIRTCHEDGSLCDFSGPPTAAPAGCRAWFDYPHSRGDVTVICGHWSALGFYRGMGILALDSGCVWGKKLTAVRLEDQALFQEDTIDPLV